MKPKTALAVIAALFLVAVIAPQAVAQDFIIRYSEGSVELQQRGRWTGLYPGDVVPTDAELRLGQGGYAEISDGRTTLRLAQPGVFQMENLLGGRSAPTGRTIASMVRSRVQRLSERPRPAEPTVGGTRATEAPSGAGIEWVGGESPAELIEAGRDALLAGDIDEAFDLFDEALLYAGESEEPEAAFYLGYTLFLTGEMRGALTWLRKYSPNPDTDYYHEHVMTLAQTQLELSLTHDTIALLTGYADGADHETELLPTAHLLLGLGHRINGDNAAARRELQRVQALSPGSATATTAAQLLREL